MQTARRIASLAFAFTASITALYAPGCGGGDDHHEGADAPDASVADVAFGDGTNDEALLALIAATPASGGATAPTWLSPAPGSLLPASGSPPTFTWSEPIASLTPRRRLPWLSFGEGVAFAHGTVTNGRAYFLVVSTPSNPKSLRAFTKASTVALPPAVWDEVRKTPGTLQIALATGVFDNGRLVQGSAAAMSSVSFEVK